MNRRALVPALLLGLIAVAIPPERVAHALLGQELGLLPSVRLGVWLFKVLLGVHAVAWYVLARWRPSRADSAFLAEPASAGPEKAAWRWEGRTLLALLVVGAGLRLIDLGDGLWFDEIRTLVEYARRPVSYILSTFESQNQHVLYSLMARGSVALFGDTAWAVRVPAAVLGVLSLGAVWWLGILVATRREALLATGVLAFSYHHVWFSQNARGYTGLLLLTLLGSGLYLKILRGHSNGWGLTVAYGLTMALAAYMQLAAVFVSLAHGLIWLALLWRRRGTPVGVAAWVPGIAVALSGTLAAQLYSPVLPQLLHTISTPTMAGVESDWKNPLWLVRETVRGLARGLPGGVLGLGAALVVLTTGLASYWRSGRTETALMVLPALLTAGGYLWTDHNLWPRMFFFAAGFVVLIAIRGGVRLAQVLWPAQGTRLAIAGAMVVIALSATTVPRAWNPKQDFRGALAFVERTRASDDAVVTVDLSRYPYESYLAAGWTPAADATALEQIEQRHPRTWVLYTFPTRLAAVQPDLWARLNHEYMKVAEFPATVGGGAVVVLVRV